jgi:hypothetical protein
MGAHGRVSQKSQATDFHSVGSKLEHLTKHGLGEAYRRYAGGYVPNLWARRFLLLGSGILLRSTSYIPVVVQICIPALPGGPAPASLPPHARR